MGRLKKKKSEVKTFGDWYEKNKGALSERRKKKYKDNKTHRESLKDKTNEAYRLEHGILKGNRRIVVSEGEKFVAYKLADAAEMLGTTVTTMRWYSTEGYIPAFPLDGSPMRVVTVDQLILLRKFFKRIKKKSVSEVYETMADELIDNWRKRDGSKKIIDKKEKG